MIISGLALVVIFVSLFRMFSALNVLNWTREFNRTLLGLLVVGFSVMPEWGPLAVILDVVLILVCMFVLRTVVLAQGEGHD